MAMKVFPTSLVSFIFCTKFFLGVSGPQILQINHGYTLKQMRGEEELHHSDHSSDADAIEEAYDAIDQFEKRRMNQQPRLPMNYSAPKIDST